MGMPKCETCRYYKQEPIVKNEGVCTDPKKAIFVNDKITNDCPQVFDFSWCTAHEVIEGKAI